MYIILVYVYSNMCLKYKVFQFKKKTVNIVAKNKTIMECNIVKVVTNEGL